MTDNIESEDIEHLDKALFADALHIAAKNKNITQDMLAERIGKSKTTISKMFSAKKFTSIPTLIEICKALDVTPDTLLESYLLSDGAEVTPNSYLDLKNKIKQLSPSETVVICNMIDIIKKNLVDKK